MRYLGIDYGSKRVGVAFSDERNTVAFPLKVLENNSRLFEELLKIVEEKGITSMVLGESKNFHGELNTIMQNAAEFKRKIEDGLHVSVMLEPEFMTSVQASRNSTDEANDASAAALILQSYLDRISQKQ